MESIKSSQPPAKKTFFLSYLGSVFLNRRYVKYVQTWIASDLKYKRNSTYCSLSIDEKEIAVTKEDRVLINLTDVTANGNLNREIDSFKGDGLDPLSAFSHPLSPLPQSEANSRYFSILNEDSSAKILLNEVTEIIFPTTLNPTCVGLVVDKPCEALLSCHIFEDEDINIVRQTAETLNEFFAHNEKVSHNNCSSMISKNVKREDLDSVRFEVMLLGKIQVKQEYPHSNFIDEAVDKYHSLEKEHKILESQSTHKQMFTNKDTKLIDTNGFGKLPSSLLDGSRESSVDIIKRKASTDWSSRRGSVDEERQRCNSVDAEMAASLRRQRTRVRHRSEPGTAATLGFDKNKTKLMQVGKQSLTLISPDSSAKCIEIPFTVVIRCTQGSRYKEYFGVFIKDNSLSSSLINKDEFRFRCYLFLCSEESVCEEILQAMKQACNMCSHGPDPLKAYQTLCKQLAAGGGRESAAWVERGMNLAAKCIAESFSDGDQRRIKSKIEESYKTNAAQSKYEKLVFVMTTLRAMLEEKQAEHDLKVKQLMDPNSSNMTKKFNFIKSRAKKSLTNIENLFGKGMQKMHELQHEAEHHISSPVEKLRFFGDNTRSAPSTPIQSSGRQRNRSGSPSSFTDVSPLAGSRTKNIVLPEPMRPRSNTIGSTEQGSINVRRKLNLAQNPAEGQLKQTTGPAGSQTSLKSSFSTPYLKRLGRRLLEGVQESPAEGDNKVTLTSSRFSLTRLFGGNFGDQKNAESMSKTAESMSRNAESASKNAESVTKNTDMKPTSSFKPYKKHDSAKSSESSKMKPGIKLGSDNEDSEEEDAGLFFMAKTSDNSAFSHPLEGVVPLTQSFDDTPSFSRPLGGDTRSFEPLGGTVAQPSAAAFPKINASDISYDSDAASDGNPELELPCVTLNFAPISRDLSAPGGRRHPDFLQVGSVPLRNRLSSESTPVQSRSHSPSLKDPSTPDRGRKLTFHQEIFFNVTTPDNRKKRPETILESPSLEHYMRPPPPSYNTPNEVRIAWRRAIKDQMLLNRINKIRDDQQISEVNGEEVEKTILDYPEPSLCSQEMVSVWEELLATDERELFKIDPATLHTAVKKGVPCKMRGKVWTLLFEQWKLQQGPNKSVSPVNKTPYRELLRKLTPHQHAILIDLGRTFPTHPYFSQQLGRGQLALYNLLKAYSLVDDNVGYCQGLSFVAGIILIHMNSAEKSYKMLSHLMFGMATRKLYLPDLTALQVTVYQLSRLLHDFQKDLYDHFQEHDVTLMLFVAPWFLTMFASILPFGFTARIFDLIFLEGTSALFKAAFCLLRYHREKILLKDSFEATVNYLKVELPAMKDNEIAVVINEIFELDIGEKLRVYEVEYNVLEEGVLPEGSSPGGSEEQEQERLERVNEQVSKYNVELLEQLEAARMQISSLQQGLNDMVTMEEKRCIEMEDLKQENEKLKLKLL